MFSYYKALRSRLNPPGDSGVGFKKGDLFRPNRRTGGRRSPLPGTISSDWGREQKKQGPPDRVSRIVKGQDTPASTESDPSRVTRRRMLMGPPGASFSMNG
jgi:hypothetical protein